MYMQSESIEIPGLFSLKSYWWFSFWKTAITLHYIKKKRKIYIFEKTFLLNTVRWSVILKTWAAGICSFNNSCNFNRNLQSVWGKKNKEVLQV